MNLEREQRGRSPGPPSKIDSFKKQQLRKVIHDLYAERICPSVPDIQAEIRRKEIDINLSDRHMRNILHQMGYVHRKSADDRDLVVERPEAILARAQFLRDIKRYRDEGYNVYYLDETWINKNHHRSLAWYPNFELLKDMLKDRENYFQAIPSIPSGKGKRMIILHVGSATTGFLEDMEMVIKQLFTFSCFNPIFDNIDATYLGERNQRS